MKLAEKFKEVTEYDVELEEEENLLEISHIKKYQTVNRQECRRNQFEKELKRKEKIFGREGNKGEYEDLLEDIQ